MEVVLITPFYEKIQRKAMTLERLDTMLIDDKNDEIRELKEQNEALMQKIAELEGTIDDMKVSLPKIRMKDEDFTYKIQILPPNSSNYTDFVTVHKNIWSDIETTKYLVTEIYNIVEEGIR